jgi:hypothetical protein
MTHYHDLPKLLRAMASGTSAIENNHDVILHAAADELELRQKQTDHMDRMMTMLEHQNAKLMIAIRPFVMIARGERMNPGPLDWMKANEVYTEIRND